MNNIEWLFPDLVKNFPKLLSLRNRLYSLEKIQSYENSDRSIKIFNPITFYQDFQRNLEGKKKMEVEVK
jgi:hypothetical protein